MLLDGIYSQVNFYNKSLDASWLRNEVTTNNIANVDTPGYKAKRVEFEGFLKNSLTQQDLKNMDMEAVDPKIVDSNGNTNMKLDGNNVDVDTEMANLAKNQIVYNAMLQQVSREFAKLKMVMK